MLRGWLPLTLVAFLWFLIAVCGVLEAGRNRNLSEQHQTVAQLEREAWTGQPDRNPHRATHFGQFAFRPPAPLGPFERGIHPYAGSGVYLESHVRHEPVLAPYLGTPPSSRMGFFDINAILNLILPLALAFLGARRIPYEARSGLLRILESEGASRSAILVGKTLGLWGVAFFCFDLPLFLIGVGWFSWFLPAMIPHLFFLLVVCALYHLTISAVIIGVSSYGRSEQGSVALTLGVLLGLNLFLPKALPPLSELLVQENGVGELRRNLYTMLSQAPDGHRPGGAEFEKIKESLLNQYGAKALEELPINYEGVILQVAEEKSSAIFQQVFRDQWDRFLRQEALTLALGAIAPALTQRVLAMHFSQTHLRDQIHFEDRVEKHRSDFVRELNQMVTAIPHKERKTKKLPSSTWEQIPSFRFESLSFLSALRNAYLPFLIAALQCFLALRFVARRRLPG